ncbi:MAG: outer membrane protein assembly factor BamA [Thermoanaerobaculia bacterium]|nr:outer membrane protein assembly factor BamA [Thermoanaerobaculia bacterium]
MTDNGNLCEGRIGALATRVAGMALWCLVMAGASVAQLAPPTSGPVIKGVEYEGLTSLSAETVSYYLGLEIGQPLDILELNRRIHTLWDRGLIDDLVISEHSEGDGIVLEITLKERPLLRSVDYEGLKKLNRSDVEDRVDRDRIRVREGLPLETGELVRLERAVVDMYAEKGYRFAEVSHTIEKVNVGEVRVQFSVDEGDKVKIEDVNFEGNTVFSDFRLSLAMRKTRPTGVFSKMLKRDLYNPATYEEDMERVRELYRERGYKNLLIGEPELEIRALKPDAASVKEQKRRLFLTIPIDEGERWKFGEISVDGNEVYSDELLLRAFDRPRTEWLKASAIDKGVESIGDLYRNSGYIYSTVDVELKEAADNVANILIHVAEADQYTVGRLEFSGNDRTRDRVLRREFRVQEGRVLNMGALRSSLYKLNQLGYFKLDEDNPVEFENFDTEKHTVDLRVQGEEADRTELLFGGGWSELDGFFGQFSIRTQNFLGRGETLSVAVQTGGTSDRYDFSYFIPWIRDRPQSAGFQIFDRSFDYRFIDQRQRQDQTGVVLTYGRSVGLFHSFRTSYSLTDLSSRIESTNATGGIDTFTDSYRKSTLRPAWLYDSQDSRIEPTRGMRFDASVEYAGGFLGGEVEFWRPEVSFTYYRPVTRAPVRTVVGINAETGYLKPFGDQDLPLLERYYIGGSRSVRGFANRSLFLRDDNGNAIRDQFGNILGGTEFAELGLEYHVLLGGPFRVVFFADAGGVFDPSLGVDYERDSFRYSAGAELRMFVPVFGLPLRFIYASNLDEKPGDRFESFQFDVGTSF